MMEVSIRDFLRWYREGRYETSDHDMIRNVTGCDISVYMYFNDARYRDSVVRWMADIYGLVSGITDQSVLDGFFIRTNCDELCRYIPGGNPKFCLIPYDSSLIQEYGMGICIVQEGPKPRFQLTVHGRKKEFRDRGALIRAVNRAFPKHAARTNHRPSTEGAEGKKPLDSASNVLPVAPEEAHEFFDMENEQAFPVFGGAAKAPDATVIYHIRLALIGDDKEDAKNILVTVPRDVSPRRVALALKDKHAKLDEADVYSVMGRKHETLLDEVCRENGWTWKEFPLNIDLTLD